MRGPFNAAALISSFIAVAWGWFVMYHSKSVMHEIEGIVSLGTGAMLFVIFLAVNAVLESSERIETQVRDLTSVTRVEMAQNKLKKAA